jgi:hypothetical protein
MKHIFRPAISAAFFTLASLKQATQKVKFFFLFFTLASLTQATQNADPKEHQVSYTTATRTTKNVSLIYNAALGSKLFDREAPIS